MKTRIDIANEVAIYANTYKHFLLDYFPRVGKSVTATALCNHWLRNGDLKVLILSDSNTTNKQWIENIKEHNDHLLSMVTVKCYQSLHKVEDIYDVIMIDEAELANTDKRKEFLRGLSPKHWIAMSGTWTMEAKMFFRELTNNQFYSKIITLEQAVDWGILPKPTIYCVNINLENSRRYLTFTKKGKKKGSEVVTFPERFRKTEKDLIIQCTEQECSTLHDQNYEKWKSITEELQKPFHERSNFGKNLKISPVISQQKMFRAALDRKKFYAKVKTKYYKQLHKRLMDQDSDSRLLVFCGSIEQAEFLNSDLSVHSAKPDSLELLEAFNSGEVNTLLNVRMLDRGVDIYKVDYCIIIQADNSQNSIIQRAGRSLLSIAPKIIILKINGTRDEDYVAKFLANFPTEWVKRRNL